MEHNPAQPWNQPHLTLLTKNHSAPNNLLITQTDHIQVSGCQEQLGRQEVLFCASVHFARGRAGDLEKSFAARMLPCCPAVSQSQIPTPGFQIRSPDLRHSWPWQLAVPGQFAAFCNIILAPTGALVVIVC